ncbi:PREDICTED: 50S ribosomal protein L21, chloroplastic-like [Tarenaya hassleriana]|uniref:50S ribosomal protein L21, chloroplastic-like n=1 Tax=Tarenaya hassleriana TaxID=28532 RepID=UPI00053C7604|nr:PREDICTED: 50S ribosomal protein L21, chloroplastic-like [Tarenaya hassleriana]
MRKIPSLVSLSKPSISLAKIVPGFLAPPVGSSRPAFPLAPKFAESESPVVDSEPEASDSGPVETAEDVEIALEQPKREEVFAVVMVSGKLRRKIPNVGGRQYIVFPGRYLYTQRLKDANVNDKIVLNKVLLVGTKTHTYIGKPVVTNAAVHAVVEDHGLNDKVVVFKYKPKKKYRRNNGHRQPNTRIRITGITGYEDYPAAANVAV